MVLGVLKKLAGALTKTSGFFRDRFDSLLSKFKSCDNELIERIEEMLVESDVGIELAREICSELRSLNRERKIKTANEAVAFIRKQFSGILSGLDNRLAAPASPPAVIFFVGVNGSGKTTSIGKLAHKLKTSGKKPLLTACDTFRAAAVDQLEIWARRASADIVRQERGADPAAVCYDAIDKAVTKGYDYVLVDTAGRLQTKENLMRELGKLAKVVTKRLGRGPDEVLLVLDASTGQNALSQAKEFKAACSVTGIVLTKLDGTAKGGIIIAIAREFGVPVKFVGTGETIEDIDAFDRDTYLNSLFGEVRA